MEIEKKIYLICSVRNASEKERKAQERYVRRLESLGHKVHYPPRDVDQKDETGINICLAHKHAIGCSTEVRAIWNPESEGSVFDLGMAFRSYKTFYLANKRRVEKWLENHPGKSYTMVAYELDKLSRRYNASRD